MNDRTCAGQFNEATSDVEYAVEFLKDKYVDDLEGYDGDSVRYIVAVLRERYPCNASSARSPGHHRRNTSTPLRRDYNSINSIANNNSDELIHATSSSPTTADDYVTVATPDVAMGDRVGEFFDAADGVVEEYAIVGWTTDALGGAIRVNNSGTETNSNNRSSVPPPSYFENDSYAERLLEIAHIFHFVSIAILGIFVIQVR